MKKLNNKKKILILAILVVIILISCVALYVHDNTPNLAYGMYFSEDAMSWVWIQEDGTGHYQVYLACNRSIDGPYDIKDDILIIDSKWGECSFKIKNKKLELIEGNYLTEDEEIEIGKEFKWSEEYVYPTGK